MPKNYENKCRLHEISRHISWEAPWGAQNKSKIRFFNLGPRAPLRDWPFGETVSRVQEV